MTTETMTIHKGLSTLKVLDERISKEISSTSFTFAQKHSLDKVNGKPLEQVKKDIAATYDSITDMMKRKYAIKQAIVLSNATTKVSINGMEMTVAEAIEMKNNMVKMVKSLRDRFSFCLRSSNNEATRQNETLDDRADNYAKGLYEGKDVKKMSEEIKDMRQSWHDAMYIDVVDPLGAEEKIKALDDFITMFMSEVDAELSSSNAITTITVTY